MKIKEILDENQWIKNRTSQSLLPVVSFTGKFVSVKKTGPAFLVTIEDGSDEIVVGIMKISIPKNVLSVFNNIQIGDEIFVEGTLCRSKNNILTVSASKFYFN